MVSLTTQGGWRYEAKEGPDLGTDTVGRFVVDLVASRVIGNSTCLGDGRTLEVRLWSLTEEVRGCYTPFVGVR